MTQNKKDMFLMGVRRVCEQEPTLLPEVIDAATAGVKDFAKKQDDRVTRMSYQMCSILEGTQAKHLKAGYFSVSDLLNTQRGILGGTPALEEMMTKFNVSKEDLDAAHERNK